MTLSQSRPVQKNLPQAIILAAGTGSRLKKYTSSCHKALLPLQGKTLLEWQVQRLRANGIENITVVVGYAKEQFESLAQRYQLNLVVNENYAHSNMVESLACCRGQLVADCLICYGDLWYTEQAISMMLTAPGENVLAVDSDWHPYWLHRFGQLSFDLEELRVDERSNVTILGREVTDPEAQEMRYVGLIKFSHEVLLSALDAYANNPFFEQFMAQHQSRVSAYMTDLINFLVGHQNIEIKALDIGRRWLEFDTVEDYELALDWPTMVSRTQIQL